MYQVRCPNCGRRVEFRTGNAEITDSDVNEKISLRLHGKTETCQRCGAIAKLVRVVESVPAYRMNVVCTLPIYDKDGKIIGYHDPGGREVTWL